MKFLRNTEIRTHPTFLLKALPPHLLGIGGVYARLPCGALRAKAAASDIAKDLIRLYAERRAKEAELGVDCCNNCEEQSHFPQGICNTPVPAVYEIQSCYIYGVFLKLVYNH